MWPSYLQGSACILAVCPFWCMYVPSQFNQVRRSFWFIFRPAADGIQHLLSDTGDILPSVENYILLPTDE
jgi:hypothetical protein